ncbi:MAG: glycosyltransferase family 2 protein [Betaproteobacteria bacterium]|nr:MAG: glycosyltransferase family 2 protein [Betaproteobacteria bacterium]
MAAVLRGARTIFNRASATYLMERVFVLLPVHNRRCVTEKFADCLLRQTYQNLHLILIDDGSSDGTAEAIRTKVETVSVIRGNGNWWWSGCMQQGFRWLTDHGCRDEDVVLLANDDINFGPEFISAAVATLARSPGDLLGARYLDSSSGKVVESGIHADLRSFVFRTADSPKQINCLPTRALFLLWKDMKRVGSFHPTLLPHYLADYEYTLRATRRGLRCFTAPEVVITADLDTTGYHNLDAMLGWRFIRRLFSVKTPLNPVYLTAFVALTAPGLWKPINILNVWVRAGSRIIWQGLLHLRFPRTVVHNIIS